MANPHPPRPPRGPWNARGSPSCPSRPSTAPCALRCCTSLSGPAVATCKCQGSSVCAPIPGSGRCWGSSGYMGRGVQNPAHDGNHCREKSGPFECGPREKMSSLKVDTTFQEKTATRGPCSPPRTASSQSLVRSPGRGTRREPGLASWLKRLKLEGKPAPARALGGGLPHSGYPTELG